MDLFGMGQIGSALIDLGGDIWKQDRAESMQDHSQNFTRDMAYLSEQFANTNREWQERMSNTQYQRATADMMQAGLNPMLAYSKGGAGTPSGAQGTASGAGSPGAPGMRGTNIMHNMATAAQIQEVMARVENIRADTRNKEAETPNILETNAQIKAMIGNLHANTARAVTEATLNEADTRKVEQVIDNLKQDLENLKLRGIEITEQTVTTHLRGLLYKAEIHGTKIDNVLKGLNVNFAANQALAQESAYMRHIAPYTGELSKIIHSASEARDAFRQYGYGAEQHTTTDSSGRSSRTTIRRKR